MMMMAYNDKFGSFTCTADGMIVYRGIQN